MGRRKAASEITLSEVERSALERLVRRRKVSRGDALRAEIVLRAAERTIMGTFGKPTVSVPRARLDTPDGRTTE